MIEKKIEPKAEYCFRGVAVSPGIAIGKAFVLAGESVKLESRTIEQQQIDTEIARFREAIRKTREDLKADRLNATNRIGRENARIFETHDMILEDPMVVEETVTCIRQKRLAADFAFYQIIDRLQEQFSNSEHDMMRERTADLKDVKRRVIRNIQGDRRDFLQSLRGAAIIIARDLTPSDTMALDRHKILGFATDLGGKTSHSAIMARSFRVPAAVGLRKLTDYVKSNDRVILDGNEGVVYVNPDEETVSYFRRLEKKIHAINRQLSCLRDLPARTVDGKDVDLAANLEFTDELENVIDFGGRGIGLYRTDYLYLERPDLPSEEEQYQAYRQVVERMRPYPVIIRTLDVGGDKTPQNISIPPEDNPYLGYRAIRICLEQPDILKTQLKAILRASVHGNVKVLFPMISGINELREVKEILTRSQYDLRKKRVPISDHIDIGIMVEVPSTAIIADVLADEVDFFSIGTNDLVQYLLAVDRGNERIAYLYKDLHPAVLRVIKSVVKAAHRKGVWVGVCGEMGGNPLATLILLGLGIDELSVSPIVLPEIKNIIRSIDYRETVRIAEKVLEMATAEDIEKFMRRYMRRKFKELIF